MESKRAKQPLVNTSAGPIPISYFGQVTLDGDDDVIRTSISPDGRSVKYKWVVTLNMRKYNFWVPSYGMVPPKIKYYFEEYHEAKDMFYHVVNILKKWYKLPLGEYMIDKK